MTSPGVIAAEVVFAALVLLAVLIVGALYTRRRLLARDSDVVTCGMRRRATGRWRAGLLRMSQTELQLLPLFGWTTRPAYTWPRYTLDLSATTPLEDAGGLAAIIAERSDQPSFRVQAVGDRIDGARASQRQRMPFELALGLQQYTALRYWAESAPPLRPPL